MASKEVVVKDIISLPDPSIPIVYGEYKNGFAYWEDIHYRQTQEDTLVYLGELENEQNLCQLPISEVGRRLWSTYKQLDSEFQSEKSGTTACSTYYDGKNNIVTATLADAASFAVVFGEKRSVLKVVRLNSVTHKPTEQTESDRVRKAGALIYKGRVNGCLAVSRAIGDKRFKNYGVIAEPQIDITSIESLSSDIDVPFESIEVITTCDGFTDGAGKENQTKEGHEEFLRTCLEQKETKGKTGKILCAALVSSAKDKKSRDNISVATIPIYQNKKPVKEPAFIGIYDGHDGDLASIYVAKNIGRVFRTLCRLSVKEYEETEYSTSNHLEAFLRDNASIQAIPMGLKSPEPSPAGAAIHGLFKPQKLAPPNKENFDFDPSNQKI